MWIDPLTAALDREYRYRRLVPMTHEQYLDEPDTLVDWTLHISAARGDLPWDQPQGGERGGRPGTR